MTKLFSNNFKYCVILHLIYLQILLAFLFHGLKFPFVPLANTAVSDNINCHYKYLDDFAESTFTSSMPQEPSDPVWLKPEKCSLDKSRKWEHIGDCVLLKCKMIMFQHKMALYFNKSSWYELNKHLLEQEAHFYMPWIQNVITCHYVRALKNTARSILALNPPELSLLTETWIWAMPHEMPPPKNPTFGGHADPTDLAVCRRIGGNF